MTVRQEAWARVAHQVIARRDIPSRVWTEKAERLDAAALLRKRLRAVRQRRARASAAHAGMSGEAEIAFGEVPRGRRMRRVSYAGRASHQATQAWCRPRRPRAASRRLVEPLQA